MGAARTALYEGGTARLSRVYAPEVPHYAGRADGRAGAPGRRVSLGKGQAVSFLELQLYNMRHVQEHAAQLNLFLGQHGVPDEALESVALANDEPGRPGADPSTAFI